MKYYHPFINEYVEVTEGTPLLKVTEAFPDHGGGRWHIIVLPDDGDSLKTRHIWIGKVSNCHETYFDDHRIPYGAVKDKVGNVVHFVEL